MANRVRIMSAAMRRRYGPGHLLVIELMIDHARDRQRWDKMVFWSRVLCLNRIYAGISIAPGPDRAGTREETSYDEAKARQARRRAVG